jgi:hypothetical protein
VPRKAVRRPGARLPETVSSGQGCLWPRCPELCQPGQLMDSPHWELVPWVLRRQFRDARREDATGKAYADSVAAITTWARRRDVAVQEAGAR